MMTRRGWLQNVSTGLCGLALHSLLSGEQRRVVAQSATSQNPLSQREGHFVPRARRIIFLFMHGGPSHVDTFDYKPQLQQRDGQPLPFAKPRIQFAQTGNLLKSPWKFRQYGDCGAWVSDLFPHVGQCADWLTFLHSLHGSNEAHGGALLKINTGSDTFVRPSLGAWLSYGLGTENASLPSFVTINPTLGHGGVRNFGSAFLPPIHQATRIATARSNGRTTAQIANLTHGGSSADVQRLQLRMLGRLDELRGAGTDAGQAGVQIPAGLDSELQARLSSFELAFRMQTEAPRLFDLSAETQATRDLYGIDQEPTGNFGTQCLLARRLSEAGVRFVQVSHAYWDQHADLRKDHGRLAAEVDRPIAGLLRDLRQRGLLEDTLVIWGAEFGRTPTAQGTDGRDHNPHAFTWWMAGGGVKAGFRYGASDEFGFYAAEDKVHVHDLHATILHLMGLDHEQLTYRYGGRDFRLTDVSGRVVSEIFG
ncbi:MAG: DUF1501 domain-containing protein [Planctomyces sp.]|jgi:hypothetical protein